MMVEQALFEEDDDDLLDEGAALVFGVNRVSHQVGFDEEFPDWFIEGIEHAHLIQGENHVDVLVRGRYIRAHKGDYVVRLGTSYTIDPPETYQ